MDTELLGQLLTATKVLAHEEEENKRLEESKATIAPLEAKHALLKEELDEAIAKSGVKGHVITGIILIAFGVFYFIVSIASASIGYIEENGAVAFVALLIFVVFIPLFFWHIIACSWVENTKAET